MMMMMMICTMYFSMLFVCCTVMVMMCCNKIDEPKRLFDCKGVMHLTKWCNMKKTLFLLIGSRQRLSNLSEKPSILINNAPVN